MLKIAEILILVLSSLVILFNVVAMICLLRNFKRLRQRMYVFIISLTAVEITVGVGYLIDVLLKILSIDQPHQKNTSSETKRTSIEGLKSSAIVLSCLNTVVVTYALHKRTTSMGRHRADTINGDSGLLHLPAFDTMLRVLSLGQNAQSTPKKQSLPVRTSLHSTSSCSETNIEKAMISPIVTRSEGKMKPEIVSQPVTHSLLASKNGKRHIKSDSLNSRTKSAKRKPMPRITHLLLPRASWIRRPSNNTSSQSYIGRHGNSVVSVKKTAVLLTGIWLIFLTMWITPVAIKLAQENRIVRTSSSWTHMFTCRGGYTMNQISPEVLLFDNILQENSTISKKSLSGSGAEQVTEAELLTSGAYPCSGFFWPLTLLHVSVNATVIALSWVVMLCSAIRLFWLRKKSSNVFVRCSALWRFIFFAAVFYFATLAPYVTICVIDTVRGFTVTQQTKWTRQMIVNSTTSGEGKDIFTNSSSLSVMDTFYLDISSCFLLIHCAVLPSLYLIRLLGFRRMLSGV